MTETILMTLVYFLVYILVILGVINGYPGKLRGWRMRRIIRRMTWCRAPWVSQGYRPKKMTFMVSCNLSIGIFTGSLKEFIQIQRVHKPEHWLIRSRDSQRNHEWWQLGSLYRARWQIYDSQFEPFYKEPTKIGLEDDHHLQALSLRADTTGELIKKILEVVSAFDCAHAYNLKTSEQKFRQEYGTEKINSLRKLLTEMQQQLTKAESRAASAETRIQKIRETLE